MLAGTHTNFETVIFLGLRLCLRYLDVPGALSASGRNRSDRELGRLSLLSLALRTRTRQDGLKVRGPSSSAEGEGVEGDLGTCFHHII